MHLPKGRLLSFTLPLPNLSLQCYQVTASIVIHFFPFLSHCHPHPTPPHTAVRSAGQGAHTSCSMFEITPVFSLEHIDSALVFERH